MRARTLTVDSLASAEEAEWEERRLCLKEIGFIFSLPNLAGGSCNKGNKEKVRTMGNKKNSCLNRQSFTREEFVQWRTRTAI